MAVLKLAEVDVHAVAGLMKLYFRELPESLFTNKLYHRFVQGLSKKFECILSQGGGNGRFVQGPEKHQGANLPTLNLSSTDAFLLKIHFSQKQIRQSR